MHFSRIFESNFSSENSPALLTQFTSSESAYSGVIFLIALLRFSELTSIRSPVSLLIIVSLSHHSLAQITGIPQAIDSIGVIPKSSSTGI